MPINNDKFDGLVPALQELTQLFLTKSKELGYSLRITHGWRSNEEQAQIYAQGRGSFLYNGRIYRETSKQIVTYAKPGQSLHNQGRAFDIYDEVKGYNLDWEALGVLGESIGLTWGGRWPQPKTDKPHFEYTGPETLPKDDMDLLNWILQAKLETYKVPGDDKVYLTFHVRDAEMFEKTLQCRWEDVKEVSAAKPSEIKGTESFEPVTEQLFKKKG